MTFEKHNLKTYQTFQFALRFASENTRRIIVLDNLSRNLSSGPRRTAKSFGQKNESFFFTYLKTRILSNNTMLTQIEQDYIIEFSKNVRQTNKTEFL